MFGFNPMDIKSKKSIDNLSINMIYSYVISHNCDFFEWLGFGNTIVFVNFLQMHFYDMWGYGQAIFICIALVLSK